MVPLIKRAPSNQQILKSGVGALSAVKLLNLVEITGQELARKVGRDLPPEVEISPITYLGVIDVIRQWVQVVDELRMTIGFARLLAEISVVLAVAGGTDDSKASCRSFKLTIMAKPSHGLTIFVEHRCTC
jgi:hypothetical protein